MNTDIFCPAGVADPTAAQAIVRALPTPQPGEVWTDAKNGKLRLILASRPKICTCLTLQTRSYDGDVSVMVDGTEMFSDPGMLFMFNSNTWGEKVGAVFPEELTCVRAAVAAVMGFNVGPEQMHVEDLEHQLKAADKAGEALAKELDAAKKYIRDLESRAPGDDGVYRALYEQLIDKLISAKVVTV